ncbi:citrate lyase subunit beta [Salmonella enterica subsp. enterica]|nr:citrate lyase subunit beta [Salmonella enterica subsp. enterica]
MISASLQQRKTRTRRSMLFVPGANAAMVSNSFIYPADALMFDLEDSVALREKMRRAVWYITRCNTRFTVTSKPLSA